MSMRRDRGDAGQRTVTIATNMAIGTDIKLCEKLLNSRGYLFWEPNGMRRDIDNQLRGRSGRQR